MAKGNGKTSQFLILVTSLLRCLAKKKICIEGATEHNLQNLSVSLPHRKLVAITGVSGAGKSTLALDIVACVARHRLDRLRGEAKALAPAYDPKVEKIEGLPSCIELIQEPLHGQNRSSIATYTHLVDFFAHLFVEHGKSRSPGGLPVISTKYADVAKWLWCNHAGRQIIVAEIQAEFQITSIRQLPSGKFFFRERNGRWNAITKIEAKKLLPASWWVAIPKKTIQLKREADASDLAGFNLSNHLWVIEDNLFLEGDSSRIAADDPVPYEPLSRRLFSFNTSGSGGGQCSTCKGIGFVRGIPEERLIQSSTVPLLEGGLNLPKTQHRFTHLGALDAILRGLFRVNALSEYVTWQDLPPNLRKTLMHGSGKEPVPELPAGSKHLRPAKRPFAGLVPLVLSRTASSGPSANIFRAWITETECPDCEGSRFNRSARTCHWHKFSLVDIFSKRSLSELETIITDRLHQSEGSEESLLSSLHALLSIYNRLNLGHLSLNRATSTLSGGEAQRLKLGLGLAMEMRDVCYVVDEPSRGLHVSDLAGLGEIFRSLVATGNTVLLVEHQPHLIAQADHCVSLGLGSGKDGGRIIYQGPPSELPTNPQPCQQTKTSTRRQTRWINVTGLTSNNVQNAEFKIPSGGLTAVVGVSGSGKSSAILKGVVPAVDTLLAGSVFSPNCKITPPSSLKFVDVVGQKLAARNPRSIVGTVTGIFDSMRSFYAALPESRSMQLTPSDFSFNANGACPACVGTGYARDGFGASTEGLCHVCNGSRLAGPAILIRSRELSLADLLKIPISELIEMHHPAFDEQNKHILSDIISLGLGHLSLGRATPTLSAGERQRLALTRFLGHLDHHTESGLLVLDEPTAGLSVSDAQQVFSRIRQLTREGKHTSIIIEHKLELLPQVDWILEFGPGGGNEGGKVIFQGFPSDLAQSQTPTAKVVTLGLPVPAEPALPIKSAPSNSKQITSMQGCELFEAFVTQAKIHDQAKLVRPLSPVIRVDSSRIPHDTRIGELLDLHHWIRKHTKLHLPRDIKPFENFEALEGAISHQSFTFSPVAAQLRLGLAVPSDVKPAIQRLEKLGFKEGIVCGKRISIEKLPMVVTSRKELENCAIICDSNATASLRSLALRLSEGAIHLHEKTAQTKRLTTQYLLSDSAGIGVSLNAPFVGDCRSPQGQCKQCQGTGRLPVYPWNLIVADETCGIEDDAFWTKPILKAIRGLRRTRILPEAKFFAKEWVADFRLAPAQMNPANRLLFEHGIPWRRFLKPTATRSDREQDYYAWRGLHDYVYLALSRIDSGYKQKLIKGYKNIPCTACNGTGISWEASCQFLGEQDLLQWWAGCTLFDWRSKALAGVVGIEQAIALGLGNLKLADQFGELSTNQKNHLSKILCSTAHLENLQYYDGVS